MGRTTTGWIAILMLLITELAGATPTTFPAGSVIIPADAVHQPAAGTAVAAAVRGLISHNGVVVYRAVDTTKSTLDATDLTVVAPLTMVNGPTPPASPLDLTDGPWIVTGATGNLTDLPASVAMWRATAPFTADVTPVLPPTPGGVVVVGDAVSPFVTALTTELATLGIDPVTVVSVLDLPDTLAAPAPPAVVILPRSREIGILTIEERGVVRAALGAWLGSGRLLLGLGDAGVSLESAAVPRLLATGGVRPVAASPLTAQRPADPLVQTASHLDLGGAVVALVPDTGGDYFPTTRTLVSGGGPVVVAGPAGGNPERGTVVYLGVAVAQDGEAVPLTAAGLDLLANALLLAQPPASVATVNRGGAAAAADGLLLAGSTDPVTGSGHLHAFDLTGDTTTPLWDLADGVGAAEARAILAAVDPLLEAEAGAATPPHPPVALNDPSLTYELDLPTVERLRGRELGAGGNSLDPAAYRDRDHRLAAIDRSTPAVVGPSGQGAGSPHRPRTIYVGTDAGLLEAVDATTGAELWALLPHSQGDLLARDGVAAQTGIDGSPAVADLWIDDDHDPATPRRFRTVLTVTMGESASALLAVDVTDPAAPAILWERTAIRPALAGEGAEVDTDGNLGPDGVAMGAAAKPALAHVALASADGPQRTAVVVVATARAKAATGRGGLHLYGVRAEDGALLWDRLFPYDGGVNDVPPPPVAVDTDGDGLAEVIVAADLEGRLWAVDAATGHPLYCADDPVVCQDPVPLYADPAGGDRPFGAPPAVVAKHGRMVVVAATGGADWVDPGVVQHLVAVEATPPARLVAPPAAGAGNLLFASALAAGERVYAQPIVRDHELYLGVTRGPLTASDGAVVHLHIEADESGVTEVARLDLAAGVGGNLAPVGGGVVGTTVDGTSFQAGPVVVAAAVATPPPLVRLYWRQVQ